MKTSTGTHLWPKVRHFVNSWGDAIGQCACIRSQRACSAWLSSPRALCLICLVSRVPSCNAVWSAGSMAQLARDEDYCHDCALPCAHCALSHSSLSHCLEHSPFSFLLTRFCLSFALRFPLTVVAFLKDLSVEILSFLGSFSLSTFPDLCVLCCFCRLVCAFCASLKTMVLFLSLLSE